MRGQNINGIITKPTLVSGSDIPSVSVDSDSSVTYLELSAEEDEAGNMDEEGLAGNIPRRLDFSSSSETSLLDDMVHDDVWLDGGVEVREEDPLPISDNIRYENKQNKTKEKPVKRVDPPTIGVMFIDQTTEGRLAKKLQEVEDRLARASGYRIRMVELSGTQLQRLLPNTNPWSGHECGRVNCYTFDQGGEVLDDCKRRNILYESRCVVCNPEEDAKPEKVGELSKKEGVYVGESARSIFERANEHRGDVQGRKDDSHVVKHWLSSHQELNSPPKFRIKVIGKFQDAMTRQIAEAVRIDLFILIYFPIFEF